MDKCRDSYNEWLMICFCLKDLYLGTDKKEEVYNLFEEYSNKSKNYNKENNRQIFLNVEPKIDINYLFKMSEEEYYIRPHYNFQKIIFNESNHKNIIKKDERFIDIEIEKLLEYPYIFIKSPTGTGKTTILKDLIKKSNVKNIISITSRRNLAGEHMKNLDLKFYMDLTNEEYKNCDRLVIQLESLTKCNYRLFKNGIIILDEINSLLSHFRSPTVHKRREVYLIEIIKNAKYIIGLDADISDWNIKFIEEIKQRKYIVYYNINKNKIGTEATIYKCPQIMIDIMEEYIKNKQYFIACFDSLKEMNKIIEHLSKIGNKKEWLIYSSEVDYSLIDTKEWIDKFIFYTPSIIYGIDFSYKEVDVFAFVHKNHLNPLQIYQMISRARKQNKVHIYMNDRLNYLKYRCVEDVIEETNLYEKNLGALISYKEIDIDDKAYRTMYYNYKYMDTLLKTNIKDYTIEILEQKGYEIKYNEVSIKNKLTKLEKVKVIKERIVNLLNIDGNNMSELEERIVRNDKDLEKHFNLRILLQGQEDDKIMESIVKNLFIETAKSKYTKLKICRKLLEILEITDIKLLNKDIIKNFEKVIENKWLTENIEIIKKTFEIKTKKYNDFVYYNIYMLLITIVRNLFDINLFIRKQIRIDNMKCVYYNLDEQVLDEHIKVMDKMKNIDILDI